MTVSASKTTLVAQCSAIVAALQNLAVTELTLGGKAYSKADAIAVFQAYLDAASNTATTKKNQQNAIQTEDAAATAARTLRSLLRAFLQSRFGTKSPELTAFSFAPVKTVTKTAAVKAVAVEKSLATREARHTMGKNQKKAVKGVIPTPAAAVAAAPAAAHAAAAPAPVSTVIALSVPASTVRPENGS